MEPVLLDARHVAALLSVSARQVWRLNATAMIPTPVRIGRSVRWRRDEIDAWVAAGCPPRDRWEATRERSR